MSIECPNCGLTLDSETETCSRCKYRPELASEFLWIYFTGVVLMILGLLFGWFTFFVRDASSAHWSHSLLGWWPLGPWPQKYHWLAFLLQGIFWTLAGLGITRRRRLALALLIAVLANDLLWTVLKLITGEPAPPTPIWSSVFLALEIVGLLIAARVAVSFRRLPPRVNLAAAIPK